MKKDPDKFQWKISRELYERLGIEEKDTSFSRFLYKFVKDVGDRVSDITYGAAGGRKPDKTERQEIASERKAEMEKRREKQSRSDRSNYSQKQ